ncbi:hypothetical protein ES703_116883 [subsurface metagenome]
MFQGIITLGEHKLVKVLEPPSPDRVMEKPIKGYIILDCLLHNAIKFWRISINQLRDIIRENPESAFI